MLRGKKRFVKHDQSKPDPENRLVKAATGACTPAEHCSANLTGPALPRSGVRTRRRTRGTSGAKGSFPPRPQGLAYPPNSRARQLPSDPPGHLLRPPAGVRAAPQPSAPASPLGASRRQQSGARRPAVQLFPAPASAAGRSSPKYPVMIVTGILLLGLDWVSSAPPASIGTRSGQSSSSMRARAPAARRSPS